MGCTGFTLCDCDITYRVQLKGEAETSRSCKSHSVNGHLNSCGFVESGEMLKSQSSSFPQIPLPNCMKLTKTLIFVLFHKLFLE